MKRPIDAEYFEAEAKRRDRGLGLGWHLALLFVLITALSVAVLGYLFTN